MLLPNLAQSNNLEGRPSKLILFKSIRADTSLNFNISNAQQDTVYPYQNISKENLPGEVWMEITGTDGYVVISYLGRVKSLDRWVTTSNGRSVYYKGRVLKQSIIKYQNKVIGDFIPELVCTAQYGGSKIRIRVHRLVYHLFVKNIDFTLDKLIVTHLNQDYFDNQASNLTTISKTEFSKKIYTSGRGIKLFQFVTPLGELKASIKRWKNVTQFNKAGTPLRTFESIKSASESCKLSPTSIVSALKSDLQYSAGGYFWKYGKCTSKINTSTYFENKKRLKRKLCQPVTQFGSDGKLIQIFASVAEASKYAVRCPGEISDAINGRVLTCAGYFWKKGQWTNDLTIDPTDLKIKRSLAGKPKPVYKICPVSKKILYKFYSISEAAKFMKCGSSDISRATKHPTFTCKGYHWKYL